MESSLEMFIFFAIGVGIFFVSTFLHELGHVALHRLFSGDGRWEIIMGNGNVIKKFGKITFRSWFMFSGHTTWQKVDAPKLCRALWLAGGFLANIVLAATIYLFTPGFGGDFWRLALLFNIFQALFTMIPIVYPIGPYKGMPSDGLQIYRLIRDKEQT